MANNTDPQQAEIQKNRQRFLKAHGINGKDQFIAVQTLQQVQDTALQKTDQACIYYLCQWEKELRKLKPKQFDDWMTKNDALFAATHKTMDKVTGNHSLVYCYYRKKPEKKLAFEINFKIVPLTDGKGLFRLEIDHVEVPFPKDVKIEDKS